MFRRIKQVLILVLLLGVMAGGWGVYHYQQFIHQPLNLQQEQTLLVKPGSSLRGIAGKLHKQGLLSDARLFVLMARLRGQAASMQAGEYALEPGLTPAGLLQKMVEGEVVQYGITLIEGWTFKQFRTAIEQSEQLKHSIQGMSDAEVMEKLGHGGEHPEGRFFPDTYHFTRGTSDVALLQRAYQAMQEQLELAWEGRDKDIPLKSPYEALILASIVEKETGQASERQEIAGVFTRRLLKGMRLQTDPTVIYGMGMPYEGSNIRRKDLRTDTPYNTYTRAGLPPTPIAMPGAGAIEAALHPKEGKSLYFVGKGNGYHHFSATLREHNNAVIKYQLNGRKRSFSSSQ